MIVKLFLQLAAIRLLLNIFFLDLVYIPSGQKFEGYSDMILPFPIDYLVMTPGEISDIYSHLASKVAAIDLLRANSVMTSENFFSP